MNRARNIISLLSLAATAAVSLPLVAGFFGGVHPAFDAFAHFRIHLAVLMALCALPMLAVGLVKEAATAIAFAVAAIATTSASIALPGLGTVQAAFHPKEDDQAVYRLLHMNVRFDNAQPEKVLSLIGRVKPDVITLNEVSPMWAKKFELLVSAYPHRILCPYPNGRFGVAILSRRPFDAARCDERGDFALASVDFGGQAVDVAAVHLSWPWPFEQAWQIGGLTPSLASLGKTALLAGDMNAAPWSAAVDRVAKNGGLTLMPSPGPTWLPYELPRALQFAGLPIDQVFAKGEVRVNSLERLEDDGSDHLPVLVEFSLKPVPATPDQATATAAADTVHPPKA